MRLKSARTAARAAAVGGSLVLGLGSAQAAMAGGPATVHVRRVYWRACPAISGVAMRRRPSGRHWVALHD